MRGYVYVLTNVAMPGLVKIGFSTRDPRERATELGGTGVPHAFEVHYEAMVDEPFAAERYLHEQLRRSGVHEDKEFFRLSPEEAVHRVRAELEALGRAVLFEPRRAYQCMKCRRWGLQETCACTATSALAIKRWLATSHESRDWFDSSLRSLRICLDDRSFLGTALFGCGISASNEFGDRIAAPILFAAALLDNPSAQESLASVFAGTASKMQGIAPDAAEAYFWGQLASSNPQASTKVRVGGRLWADDAGRVLAPEAKAQCDARVLAWVANYRPNPSWHNAHPAADAAA